MTSADSITFIFPKRPGKFVGGQCGAALMLMQMLKGEGYQVRHLHLPVLNRSEGLRGGVRYGIKLVAAWVKVPVYGFSGNPFYMTIGQTKVAVLRDFFPYFFYSFFSGRHGCIALHGSLFMEPKSLTGIFRWMFVSMLKHSKAITVLGNDHRNRVISLGVSEGKVHIVPNPVDLAPCPQQEIDAKQAADKGVLKILFLSLLVDSKGYPEYLEALKIVAKRSGLLNRIDAVLCGPLTDTGLSDRFPNQKAARIFIESTIGEINNIGGSVRVRWIEGAVGREKEALFREACIFVLPSRYRNEAQPIVIIEAIRTGAAVIATRVGQVEDSFGDALYLIDEADPDLVANAIEDLVNHSEKRRDYSDRGFRLFEKKFSPEKHLQTWKRLLGLPGNTIVSEPI